jgi:flagellar basal-body rod modification protein FlgD
MAIEGIGATDSSSLSNRAAIEQEDFLEVLLAQLQFQDPLEPMDNNEFIAQFAELTNLEQSQQLNDRLETLLTLQNGAQAIDLIGRSIEVEAYTGTEVGEVTAVAFEQGVPVLTILTQSGTYVTNISLGQIRIIQ